MIRQSSGKPTSAPPAAPLVVIVDDDEAVRASLDSLFRSVGLSTRLFGAPAELLQAPLPDAPGCIILDVRLPGVSGLDFQDQLSRQGIALPIVFVTGFGDIPMTVRAMKAGAVDFLSKPFRDQDMLDAVTAAIERDRRRRSDTSVLDDLRAAHATLTAREEEVMRHVVAGLMNKQIAGELGLSEITVKIHRGNVMRKMACERSPTSSVRRKRSGSASPEVGEANLCMMAVRARPAHNGDGPRGDPSTRAPCVHRSAFMPSTPRVAVIDDDAGVRSSLTSLIRSLGYEARAYRSGPDFLAETADGDPDCLITDIQMPGMTGDQLQSALIAAGRRFPMIFMTAFPTAATRERVMAAGACAYLDKPVEPDAIASHIAAALAHGRV